MPVADEGRVADNPHRLTWTTVGITSRDGGEALSLRERARYRATIRRRVRAATAVAGSTVAVLAAVNAVGMSLIIPERQATIVAINGSELVVGIVMTGLALRRWRLWPHPLAFLLALSTVVTVLHLLVFVPESRVASFMLLALLPPMVALFVPWSVAYQASWLAAAAAAVVVFTGSGAGEAVPIGVWVGAWLVLLLSGVASLVGSAALSAARRRSFEHQLVVRRAQMRSLAHAADLRRLNAALARATRTDPLTGLWNRLRLNEELAAAVDRSARHGRSCAVVMLDLDQFKAYNDAVGHVAGDAALKAVATALGGAVRAVDTLCRFGGEEFIVVMPDETLDGAAVAAERLVRVVEDLGIRYDHGAASPLLTISAGVALLGPPSARAVDEVVRAADQALYRAKRAGRNRVALSASKAAA
jgi:diguanylate cyclase (GGDEF)-like protein